MIQPICVSARYSAAASSDKTLFFNGSASFSLHSMCSETLDITDVVIKMQLPPWESCIFTRIHIRWQSRLASGALTSSSDSLFFKHFLADATNRADPVVRQIFECRARCDAVIRIADSGIIHIAARAAYILVHNATSYNITHYLPLEFPPATPSPTLESWQNHLHRDSREILHVHQQLRNRHLASSPEGP